MLMFSRRISPKISTFSAVAVGYLLLDDLNASEQNALGNWLMLVAQVLCTNAYFRQLKNQYEDDSEVNGVEVLSKMKDALDKEINHLGKQVV